MRVLLTGLVVAVALTYSAAGAPPRPPGGITFVPSAELAVPGHRVAVEVSPDGRRVYFLGGYDARTGIATVERAPDGRLTRDPGPEGCLSPWYVRGPRCTHGPALNNSAALAVSPDARDVVVGGYAVDQVALYRHGAGLRFTSCVGSRTGGFHCAPGRRIARTNDLAFSPDGRNLYVASAGPANGLVALHRDPRTGALTQLAGRAGCTVGRRAGPETPPCETLPVETFAPTLVRVLPDGRTVLALSHSEPGAGLFVFRRDLAHGGLTLLRCYTGEALPPCLPGIPPFGERFGGISDMAIDATGRTVFGVSEVPANLGYDPGRLTVLRIDPHSGAVSFRRCYSTPGGDGCERLALPAGAASLALATDGRSLYVGGGFAVHAYRRRGESVQPVPGTGGCASLRRSAQCASIANEPADGFYSLALSPNGRWLYAAGGSGFAFEIAPG